MSIFDRLQIIVKRFIDFIISIVLLIILFPLIIIISVIIKCDSKGPIFFLQKRIGYKGKVFKIIKFRTMIVNAEFIGDGLNIKDDSDNRITKIGHFLRKTSIDELPQLINVLKGEMSLIGPRPPVSYYPYNGYENYPAKAKIRFCMKPGISGLAQVEVRNSVPWDKRIEYDIKYVRNFSLILDLKIMFKTIYAVIKRENIY